MYENKNLRNYNNIFQPINIFSQFKRNKQNNNEDIVKNSILFKKFLDEELKKVKSNTNKNNRIKKNKISAKNKFIFGKNKNKTNIINENNASTNIVHNTNDTTPISSGNLYNNKLNNSQILNYNNKKQIFDNNIDCNEINFHIEGVSSGTNLHNNTRQKRKKFKGKKIKCIHDLSKTGLAGDDKKVNQDNYFIFKNFVQGFDNIYMGVCDGHGYYGHEVSGYIKENLPMDLNHLIKTKKLNVLTDDLSAVIKNAFILENKSLLRNRQIDSDLSGSTCVSVIYTPIKLIIANIGDSRCVLGKCIEIDNYEEKDEIIGEKKKRNIRWVAENLSRDHKPSLPEEAERILKVGGRIRPMKDEDGEFIGPLRVYMKEKDMPGLAMTRSFGDYYGSTAGVISEPEVTEYFFKPEDKFMVLASDGLFEFIESQEVIDIIKDYYERNDIVGCCEYLYKESTRKWIQEEEDTIDDITIILVFFEDLYDEVE
jgi:serine/threonine protein phosphatase PrpC